MYQEFYVPHCRGVPPCGHPSGAEVGRSLKMQVVENAGAALRATPTM